MIHNYFDQPSSYSPPLPRQCVNFIDIVFLSFCLLLAPSVILQNALRLSERSTILLAAITFVFFALLKRQYITNISSLSILSAIIFLGSIASFLSGTLSQIMMTLVLIISLTGGKELAAMFQNESILKFISYCCTSLLALGIIAIAYAASGGAPILETKAGYRTTYLYLTSFSFALTGNIIRPSGIFDEPGSFVMFVGIITIFNDTLRRNRRLNTILVLLLLSTGSLVGLGLIALYFTASNYALTAIRKNIFIISTLSSGFAALSYANPTNPAILTIETFYSERLMIEDGRLVGDNRSNQIEAFFDMVDSDMLIKGVDRLKVDTLSIDQSSNPFSIVYGYGLLISLPYFAILAFLITSIPLQGFRNVYAKLGLALLLLQRPAIYNISWSIMIAACLWMIVIHMRDDGRARPLNY